MNKIATIITNINGAVVVGSGHVQNIQEIKKFLATERIRQGLTQLHQAEISRIESGGAGISVKSLFKFAEVLGFEIHLVKVGKK